MSARFVNFEAAINASYDQLRKWGEGVSVSRWQGVETSGTFLEVLFWSFEVPVDRPLWVKLEQGTVLERLRQEIKPNLPWADDHFAERVGGKPLNPGEQYKNWPHWRPESTEISVHDGKFSHTYMERFWPKKAGHAYAGNIWGIRFDYGDLSDVVNLLYDDPYTRQAYVPIWFPEDTGVVHKERVPCSIGYFFIMRNNRLHMRYHIRSCDFNRYFRDDIYMAVRLQLWMLEQLKTRSQGGFWADVEPGTFLMGIDSLHVIRGDFSVRT